MYAAELGSAGAEEMSWFQADSSPADGAFAASDDFGKTGHAPRLGYGPLGSFAPWCLCLATARPPHSRAMASAAAIKTFPGKRPMRRRVVARVDTTPALDGLRR